MHAYIEKDFADRDGVTHIVKGPEKSFRFFSFLFRRRQWRQIRDVCHGTITAFLLEVRTLFLAISNVLPVLEFAGRILCRDSYVSVTRRHPQ